MLYPSATPHLNQLECLVGVHAPDMDSPSSCVPHMQAQSGQSEGSAEFPVGLIAVVPVTNKIIEQV